MAISNIVCRSGVGPSSSIGTLVTHGLIPATVVVTALFRRTLSSLGTGVGHRQTIGR